MGSAAGLAFTALTVGRAAGDTDRLTAAQAQRRRVCADVGGAHGGTRGVACAQFGWQWATTDAAATELTRRKARTFGGGTLLLDGASTHRNRLGRGVTGGKEQGGQRKLSKHKDTLHGRFSLFWDALGYRWVDSVRLDPWQAIASV